jgi:hypothetical protein
MKLRSKLSAVIVVLFAVATAITLTARPSISAEQSGACCAGGGSACCAEQSACCG